MDRRSFLTSLAGLGLWGLAPSATWAGSDNYQRLLVLVELKGGNDGLNTVVPFASPDYYALRPKIAIRREEVLQLSEQAGLHPALAPLLPLWQAQQLAIIQGVGYPRPNLSHFRSIEIWDTASASDQFLPEGWLTRAFRRLPAPAGFAADGVLIGSPDLGPLAGGARAIALADPERFRRQAVLAAPGGVGGNAALAHVLKVEADIAQAAARLAEGPAREFATEFPAHGFGQVVKAASQVVAGGGGVAVLRLTHGGFDTHQNQPAIQARLLAQLAEGLLALKSAFEELGLWQRTLVLTYGEFGRRPKENQSNGTDHGTANVHFALGGAVRGGFHGAAPDFAQLGSGDNLGFAVDFRCLYATALERWWGMDSREVLAGRYAPLDLLRV